VFKKNSKGKGGVRIMINRERKLKENKVIIVRTHKGRTANVYLFTTLNRNKDIPSGCTSYKSFDKIADRIEVTWNVGGDVFIHLYNRHPNGFDVKETVVFDKKYITSIEIETYF